MSLLSCPTFLHEFQHCSRTLDSVSKICLGEFVEEKSLEAANDLALQLKEEKKQFIMKKKETSILKRGGSRESEVIYESVI